MWWGKVNRKEGCMIETDITASFSADDMVILANLPMPVLHHFSRRTILVTLVGVLVGGGGGLGGFTYWLSTRQEKQVSKVKPVAPPPLFQGKLPYIYRKHNDEVSSVSWSPDGLYIVSGSYDKTAQVWKTSNGVTIQTYRNHVDKINAVMWSPKGTYIASASSDKTVHVWNSITGETIKVYKGHSDMVTALAWSPDGISIASSSDDGTIQIWHAFTGKHVLTYPLKTSSHSRIIAVAWSSDKTHIASGDMNGSFDVWDATSGSSVISGSIADPPALAWSPDGKAFTIGGQNLLVNVEDIQGNSIDNYRDTTTSASVLSLAWSPKGQFIASGGSDSKVNLWKPFIKTLDNKALVYKYQGHQGAVRGVTWSPDGFYVASCSQDKTVQVWPYQYILPH